jgi:hypothetical protein
MTTRTDETIFSQRQTLIIAAIERFVAAQQLPPAVLRHLRTLYAQGLYFEAERVAGLALWVGKRGTVDWRQTCFEMFGTVVRLVPYVLRGLAAIEQAQAWQPRAQSRAEFLAWCGISAEVYARWHRLGRTLVLLPAESLVERGTAVRRLVGWLAGTGEPPMERVATLGQGTAEVPSLDVVLTAAEQAATALLEAGRCLWQVRVQQAWQPFAETYTALLETQLGVEATFGHALSAIGQDFAALEIRHKPLARLDMLSTLLATQGAVHDP